MSLCLLQSHWANARIKILECEHSDIFIHLFPHPYGYKLIQGDKPEINRLPLRHGRKGSSAKKGLYSVYRLEEDEAFCKKVMICAWNFIWEFTHKENYKCIASGAKAPILFKGFIYVFVLRHAQEPSYSTSEGVSGSPPCYQSLQ